MRFRVDERTLTKVGLRLGSEEQWNQVSMDEFAEAVFIDNGLDISKSASVKAINDRSSSNYHEWQRAKLGTGVKVTDIDLIRVNEERDPLQKFSS